jgi:ketosteroid isomerase-like protein
VGHALVQHLIALPPIVSRYLDAYHRKDVAALIACFTDDVAFEHVSNAGGTTRADGRAALAALADESARLFLERSQTVKRAVVSGDQVALEIEFRATLTDGRALALRGASFMRLRDGRIAELLDLS